MLYSILLTASHSTPFAFSPFPTDAYIVISPHFILFVPHLLLCLNLPCFLYPVYVYVVIKPCSLYSPSSGLVPVWFWDVQCRALRY